MTNSVYIHIPFCVSKCFYCDFCSRKPTDGLKEEYITCLLAEIDKSSAFCGEKLDTVYIGGGTPSLLEDGSLLLIKQHLDKKFDTSRVKEFTVEVNPDSLTENKLFEYEKAGVTRISVGVQSTNDKILQKIGRVHTSQQAISALRLIKKHGFDMSCDMMLGLPGSSENDVFNTINTTVSEGAGHISLYMLKVEEGTPLFKMVNDGLVTLPDDDSVADMYLKSVDLLEKKGLFRYEISNFGKKSLHNLGYWTDSEYIGFGVSAHGFFDGKRWENTSDLQDYIDRIKNGSSTIVTSNDIDKDERIFERIILGLRLDEGADIKLFENYQKQLKKLDKYLIIDDRVRVRREYTLLLNQILAEF